MTRARPRVVLAAVCSSLFIGTLVATASPTPSSAPALVSSAHKPTAAAKPSASASPSASAARKAAAEAATKARASASAAAKAKAVADAKRKAEAKKRASRSKARTCKPPRTVPGLNRSQTHNALMVIKAGKRMHIPRRGRLIALATALQESHLRNYANGNVPASLNLPHEAVGYDYDSVGIFQQRPIAPWGAGSWGTLRQLMNPYISATKFYRALIHIRGWRYMAVTVAAQSVQRSAYPGAYADDAYSAGRILSALRCS